MPFLSSKPDMLGAVTFSATLTPLLCVGGITQRPLPLVERGIHTVFTHRYSLQLYNRQPHGIAHSYRLYQEHTAHPRILYIKRAPPHS